MKIQINLVSNWSVKRKLTITLLCTMLCVTGVNANNNLLTDSNPLTKETKTDIKIDNGLSKPACPFTDDNNLEAVAEDITIEIEQWMADSSYWSSDDLLLNDQGESVGTGKLEKSNNSSEKIAIENNPFLFNAEDYIPESEF